MMAVPAPSSPPRPIIADAPLTAGTPPLEPAENTGVPFTVVVGTFTDANPTAPISDFTATIDWGDGSPNSVGTITQPGGVGTAFDVTGSHTYAKPGEYFTTITVTDDGGSVVIIPGSVTVTDLPIIPGPVTGFVHNFTAVEGQDTGTIVLATFADPNTLATVADVTAFLPVDGWGDGTPSASGDHARGPGDRRHAADQPNQSGRTDLRGARQPHLHRRGQLYGQHQRHDHRRLDHRADAGHRHRARRPALQLQRRRDHRDRGHHHRHRRARHLHRRQPVCDRRRLHHAPRLHGR